MLGSRDETSGCQLCVASIADDGSLTLRLRMPDCLAKQHGKYLVIEGVRFAYGHAQVLAALASNAEYAAYRRQHGDKAARATALGQAISYRFKRDGKLDFVHLGGVGEDVCELSVNCGWGFSAVGFQPRQCNISVGQPQHEVRRFRYVSNFCTKSRQGLAGVRHY